MIKNLIITCCLLTIISCAYAQEPYFEWGKYLGTTDGEFLSKVSLDDSNNVYMFGLYTDTIDLDPGNAVELFPSTSYNNSSPDLYLIKLDSLGEYVWAKTWNTPETKNSRNIIYDESGFIYILGTFNISLNVDPGVTNTSFYTAGFYDIFVQKLDLDGNHIWAKSFHGNGLDDGYGLALDNSGDVIVTGDFSNALWFDAPYTDTLFTTNYSYDDAFVLKMDSSNGDVIWAKSFGGNGNDSGIAVDVDTSDNIVLTGFYNDTCDLNPSLVDEFLVYEQSDRSPFISKLSNSGDFIWGKGLPISTESNSGSLGGRGTSIYTSHDNNSIYLGGYFSHSMDLDPGVDSLIVDVGSFWDGFVMKLSPQGDLYWSKTIGQEYAHEFIDDIKLDTNENVYVMGAFEGGSLITSTTDTITLNSQYNQAINAYCIKLDSAGNHLWHKSIESPSTDRGTCIDVSESGDIYAGGTSGTILSTSIGSIDLDPGTNTALSPLLGDADFFIVKLNQCNDTIGTAPTPNLNALPLIYSECSVNLLPPSAYHSCAGTIQGITSDSIYFIENQGTYNIEWIYDDGYGNTASQFQSVIIADTTSPVPLTATLASAFASCDTIINAPFAIDNCIDSIQATTVDLTNFNSPGVYSITWVFDDTHGNQTVQVQTITINDTITPIPDSTFIPYIFTHCPPVTLNAPVGFDNCDGTLVATTSQPITYANEGIYDISWEYIDNSGNSITQIQQLEIELIDGTVTTAIDTLFANAAGNFIYQWLDCDNGSSPINGANGQFFVPGDNGNYAVNVYDGECSVFSSCFNVESLSLNEIQHLDIQIIPNPSNSYIMVQGFNQNVSFEYEISNAQGTIVRYSTVQNTEGSSIDISSLANGIYFIKIDNTTTKRFIKN